MSKIEDLEFEVARILKSASEGGESLVARIGYYMAAAATAEPLQEGERITVWMRKGDWWSEIRRGAIFKVTKVEGDRVWVHDGSTMSGPLELKLTAGPDASGKLQLDDIGKFRRAIIFKRG